MLRIEDRRNARVVFFADARIARDLQIRNIGDSLMELTRSHPPGNRLVLDFSQVEFMTSTMIGKLVRIRKTAVELGIEIKLRNICPHMMKVFRVTRLNMLFSIGEGDFGEDPALSPIAVPIPTGSVAALA